MDSFKSPTNDVQDPCPTAEARVEARPESYRVREIGLGAELGELPRLWTESYRRYPATTVHADPEWIQEHFRNEPQDVHIFLLEKDQRVVGTTAFALEREVLPCNVGGHAVANLRVRVLALQGYTFNIPEEAEAHDSLIKQTLDLDFDAIYLENVHGGSFLWSYLNNSRLVRRNFRFYTKEGLQPHLLIRLGGTFQNYLDRFSGKARKNRLREIRKLRERGDLGLVRVCRPSEVDEFLESAYDISRRTWTFKHRGYGLAAQDRQRVRRDMHFLAQRGWLRSYLLKCGDASCAFILGHQYGNSFYAETVAVAEEWRTLSAGTVALMLTIEDLTQYNRPEFYDFGTHVDFQENFATESYPEATVWLFRRRLYPGVVGRIYSVWNSVAIRTGNVLEGFGLKSKVKRALWRRK